MRKTHVANLFGIILLALLLVACEGFSATGSSETANADNYGGDVTVRYKKANGSISEGIETEAGSAQLADALVTLSVGKGTFKIELLGEDDKVTLSLEASDGETVSGEGQLAVDTFGSASYRVTATDAEDVEYRIDYAFRQ